MAGAEAARVIAEKEAARGAEDAAEEALKVEEAQRAAEAAAADARAEQDADAERGDALQDRAQEAAAAPAGQGQWIEEPALPAPVDRAPPKLDGLRSGPSWQRFLAWQRKYAVRYQGAIQEEEGFAAWKKNDELIHTYNARGCPAKLEHNIFSGVPQPHFLTRAHVLGDTAADQVKVVPQKPREAHTSDDLNEVDWSSLVASGTVRDQSSCGGCRECTGSCWASAAVAAVEGAASIAAQRTKGKTEANFPLVRGYPSKAPWVLSEQSPLDLPSI